MKSDESTSTLMRNQHLDQGNRLTKEKAKPRIWTLEFSFFTLLRLQSIH
jgi:hypothetical protein